MLLNLYIKNVPDHIVQRLRERAARHHRSLQGELLAIVEPAVEPSPPASPAEFLTKIRRLNLPKGPRGAEIIRADRDRH